MVEAHRSERQQGIIWKMRHFGCAFLPDQLSVCSGGKVGITKTVSGWEICAFHRVCLHAVKLKHLVILPISNVSQNNNVALLL